MLILLSLLDLVWRVIPNGLNYGDGKMGFTSFQTSAVPSNSTQQSILDCPGWFDVDPVSNKDGAHISWPVDHSCMDLMLIATQFTYGNIPVGQMAFSVDENGKASSVDLRGLRMTLDRQS